MARIEWIDARLMNWARWKIGDRSGGLGFAKVDLASPSQGGYHEARIPIDDDEAVTTNMAVQTLDADLKRVVYEWYLEPGPAETIARELGIGVSTLYARIDRAHVRVAAWIGEREKAAQAERERVEQLQRGAA
jgi:DNA-directed RNA polymerase specialized sigma24 family protein